MWNLSFTPNQVHRRPLFLFLKTSGLLLEWQTARAGSDTEYLLILLVEMSFISRYREQLRSYMATKLPQVLSRQLHKVSWLSLGERLSTCSQIYTECRQANSGLRCFSSDFSLLSITRQLVSECKLDSVRLKYYCILLWDILFQTANVDFLTLTTKSIYTQAPHIQSLATSLGTLGMKKTCL